MPALDEEWLLTFDEFLDRRLPALLRYATVITCDPHLAEDIVQEALVRAHGRWARIVAGGEPEPYLKRIVLNAFLSWRRRLAARVVPLSDVDLEARSLPVADPARGVVERDALLRQIAALPPRQRAVIALRFYEDNSDAEIAALLGCSEATVRSHCSRALLALRAMNRPQEVTHDHR